MPEQAQHGMFSSIDLRHLLSFHAVKSRSVYIATSQYYCDYYLLSNTGVANKSMISFQLLFTILVPTLSLLMLLIVFGFTVSVKFLIRKQRQAQIELIQSQVMEIPAANEDGLISDIDSKQTDMEWTV